MIETVHNSILRDLYLQNLHATEIYNTIKLVTVNCG